MTMKKSILILFWGIVAPLFTTTALAKTSLKADTEQTEKKEKKDSIYLYGLVKDKFTMRAVQKAFCTLMRSDSAVVDTAHVWCGKTYNMGFGHSEITEYVFKIKPEVADYIIKLEHPDYETAYTGMHR